MPPSARCGLEDAALLGRLCKFAWLARLLRRHQRRLKLKAAVSRPSFSDAAFAEYLGAIDESNALVSLIELSCEISKRGALV